MTVVLFHIAYVNIYLIDYGGFVEWFGNALYCLFISFAGYHALLLLLSTGQGVQPFFRSYHGSVLIFLCAELLIFLVSCFGRDAAYYALTYIEIPIIFMILQTAKKGGEGMIYAGNVFAKYFASLLQILIFLKITANFPVFMTLSRYGEIFCSGRKGVTACSGIAPELRRRHLNGSSSVQKRHRDEQRFFGAVVLSAMSLVLTSCFSLLVQQNEAGPSRKKASAAVLAAGAFGGYIVVGVLSFTTGAAAGLIYFKRRERKPK